MVEDFLSRPFLATGLSAEMQNTDRIPLLSQKRGVGDKVLMPSINKSDFHFTDGGDIRYGLGAIKGLGAADKDDGSEGQFLEV